MARYKSLRMGYRGLRMVGCFCLLHFAPGKYPTYPTGEARTLTDEPLRPLSTHKLLRARFS